jgi:hypothetical protein
MEKPTVEPPLVPAVIVRQRRGLNPFIRYLIVSRIWNAVLIVAVLFTWRYAERLSAHGGDVCTRPPARTVRQEDARRVDAVWSDRSCWPADAFEACAATDGTSCRRVLLSPFIIVLP